MPERPIKVYISVDMEGIGGVLRPIQVQQGTLEYERACRWMEAEVNAYIRGAKAAGAEEVWVKDAHGSGANMDWEAFRESAILVSGRNRPARFPGLDASFTALFLVGYHAQAGTVDAVLDHTWSSSDDTRFLFNGVEVGEIAVDAAIAGAFGVPVALVSGDDKTALEAQALLKTLESVVVKTAVTREGAICLPQTEVLNIAEEGAKRAVERTLRNEFSPYKPSLPVRFEKRSQGPWKMRLSKSSEGNEVRKVIQEVLGQG